MGAASSKSRAWYPGEPDVDVLSVGCDDNPESPSPPYGREGGRVSEFFDVAQEIKGFKAPPPPSWKLASPPPPPSPQTARTTTTTAATTTRAAALRSPSPPPPTKARRATEGSAREKYGDGNARGSGTNPAITTEPRKKATSDINTLPVIELEDMEFVARGAYCAVFACKYRGQSVVAKCVREDLPLPARQATLDNLWEEFECLRLLSHPNIVEAYGMCRVKCHRGYNDCNEEDVCLLLEKLAVGTVGHLFGTIYNADKNLASLFARWRMMKMVPFRCRLDRVLELALALEHLHGGSGIGVMLHRDIKSVNVGFAQDGRLKLMDFGLSKIIPLDTTENDTYEMTGEVGSYRYMAPEVVNHQPYNAKVDIYSWAILSWEILAIEKPYAKCNESTFIERVVNGGERPELLKSWPNRLCKLLSSAWHADHTERPAATKLVAELSAIRAELADKYRRQRPSITAVTPQSSSRSSRGSFSRQLSWAPQGSSSPAMPANTRSSRIILNRTQSGGGGGGDDDDDDDESVDSVRSGLPSSSATKATATTTLQPAVSSAPLRASSTPFSPPPRHPAPTSGRRRQRRSFFTAKCSLSPGKQVRPATSEAQRSEEAAGIRKALSAEGAVPKPTARRKSALRRMASRRFFGEDDDDETRGVGRGEAGGGDAGAGEAARASADGDGGCRKNPRRRSISQQGQMIIDALARDAEAGTRTTSLVGWARSRDKDPEMDGGEGTAASRW